MWTNNKRTLKNYQMKNTDINKILFLSGSVITIVGSLAKFFNVPNAAYLFSIGVAMLVYIQFKHMLDTRKLETREKRLAMNGIFSSFILALAAYFMFTNSNSWMAAVLVYALSSLITSFRGERK